MALLHNCYLSGAKGSYEGCVREMNALGNDMHLRIQEILSQCGIRDLDTFTATLNIQPPLQTYECGLGNLLPCISPANKLPSLRNVFHHLLSHTVFLQFFNYHIVTTLPINSIASRKRSYNTHDPQEVEWSKRENYWRMVFISIASCQIKKENRLVAGN